MEILESTAPDLLQVENTELFEQMPTALWAEDFSALKKIFDAWRKKGVTDLQAHLRAVPDDLKACARSIKILKVNQRALAMLGMTSTAQLIENLPFVMRDEVLPAYANELFQLWEGRETFSTKSINYTIDGRRIDIRINGVILPEYRHDWSRVIVAIEDVTSEEDARRNLLVSEAYARSLFNDSPVSLWVEDFSAIKSLLEELKLRGISDFRTFIDVHPDFVERCTQEISVLDVNQYTLTLFGASDKADLINHLGDLFRDEMRVHFAGQLVELWAGKLRHEREVVNYNMAGEPLNLILQFSVMPGFEQSWSRVLVSLTDITARKKAEAYLEYLGKHDVLTGLYNRAYYADEIHRLDRRGPFPVSVIVIDLNGMKAINDELGHAAGDGMLRRVGEILAQTIDRPACAARIGGDEFVLLLPSTNAAAAQFVLADLLKISELNNQFNSNAPPVNFSVGIATCEAGERMEATIQKADMLMYESKRQFYTATPGMDRRA